MREPITDQTVSDIVAKVRSGVPDFGDFLPENRRPLVHDLSRWEWWALVGFVRHARRQKWVGYIVETKLKASGCELGAIGAFAHPEGAEQHDGVPDTPGWRYYFHGRGCCLTHEDGTTLDVDFADDGSSEEIDPYFYTRFLASAPKLDWSDAQLHFASPFDTAWHFDLKRLGAMNYIRPEWRFRVTDESRRLVERLEPIIDEINRLALDPSPAAQVKMGWLLTVLGDSVSAARTLSTAPREIARIAATAAAIQIADRASLLGAAAKTTDHGDRRTALTALAVLGRTHVEAEVIRTFETKPPTSAHLLGLQIAESWKDSSCEPIIVNALNRFSPSRGLFGFFTGTPAHEKIEIERPRNGFLVGASRLILSFHTPATISQPSADLLRRVLAADCKACDAEAGFLLYLLSPHPGLAKIKANLRNQVPITREEAAVFLAMIATDEAIDALLTCAAGPPENGGHEAACALSLIDDQRTRTAFANWKSRNDGYEEAEATEIEFNGKKVKTWKMDDVMRAEMQNFIQGNAERLQRDYGPLLSKWSRR